MPQVIREIRDAIAKIASLGGVQGGDREGEANRVHGRLQGEN
jgi:hypothetical protein